MSSGDLYLLLVRYARSLVPMLRSQSVEWGNTVAFAALCSLACSSSLSDPDGGDSGGSAPSFTGVTGGTDANQPGSVGIGSNSASSVNFGVSDAPTNEVQVVCAAQSAASELRQVALAFLFDVSGSMGGDNRNRFETKWLPIVAASEAFFSEADATALSASMTFFPRADADTRCTDGAYLIPDVPETPLPSPLFAQAINALDYTLGSNNWRSSTPTLPAYRGLVGSLAALAQSRTTRAIVMVTDGVPQGCDNADDVQLVADAVRASGITTFVIGVANPPGDNAGDNLANLNVIAEAGRTESAFIVATGNPEQTKADFKAVIDEIRGVSLACNVQIPLPPAGSVFLPEQVNVVYGSSGVADVPLNYDPDCLAPDAWRYDDATDPSTIVLCTETCGRAQRDASARLSIEFGCQRRSIPR